MIITAKPSLGSETVKDKSTTATPSYLIEHHSQLIEETVLRVIIGHPEESIFREKRDTIYEWQDDEVREEEFQKFHQFWFDHLGLGKPLLEVLNHWPILKESTHRCLLLRARNKKDLGAELFIEPRNQNQNPRIRRTIVLHLSPELICQTQHFLQFLRHEMLHVVDMLDPNFGYEPEFPKASAGPTYDLSLRQRYSILWDITIDGRLYHKGWLPKTVRQKHLKIFKRAFPGLDRNQEELFSHFFDNGTVTHAELVSYAQNHEVVNSDSLSKGRCSLCHFPSFDLIYDSASFTPDVLEKILKENPDWNPSKPICRQCVDLLDAHISTI